MPNTTNFNWPTPADTDLVKDGAAAIRNLGNGVDTSLVDLKGGTTGQILSKASNADMDFTFVTPNVGDLTEVQAGTGISVADGTGPIPVVTNTVATAFDAKGDLVVGTGADTFAKLTVGTNGHTLVADSVEATGLKWAAPTASTPVYTNIASGTITSGTTLTLSSLTSYDNIRLTLASLNCGTDGSGIRIRFNGTTSSNYQNNNGVLYINNTGSTFTAATVTAASTSITNDKILTNGFLSPGTSNNIFLNLFGCKSSSGYIVGEMIAIYESSVATGEKISYGNIGLASNAALSSITIEWEDGYAFTGGNYRLIGA